MSKVSQTNNTNLSSNVENRVVKGGGMATRRTVTAFGKRTALAPTTNVQNLAKLSINTFSKPGQSKPLQIIKGVDKKVVAKSKAIVKTRENVAPKTVRQITKPTTQATTSKIPKLNASSRFPTSDTLGFSQKFLPSNVENIDENDANNVLLTPEYVNDIYGYIRYLESKQSISANFLENQKEMTPKMRSILIDWIINVHYQFRLLPETLYLSVSIMDRFFQKEDVSKDKIQLVGVTSCFIASKFEEIYPPDLRDFVVICDELYSKNDIIKCEMNILRSVKFELGRPLPLHFLRRNSKAAHADSRIHTMAKYLMELTLVEYECAHWKPSVLAATALRLSLKLLVKNSQWGPTVTYYSGYSADYLEPYVSQMCTVVNNLSKSKYQNCKKKYSSDKLMNISKSPELNSSYIKENAAKTATPN